MGLPLAGLTVKERVRMLDIRKELGESVLLLQAEKNHLSWFLHVIRTSPSCIPLKASRDIQLERSLRETHKYDGGVMYPI